MPPFFYFLDKSPIRACPTNFIFAEMKARCSFILIKGEASLAQILENTRDVDFDEVIIPVDGLGVEIEHLIFRSLHHHRQPQPLHVHVIKASSSANQKIYRKRVNNEFVFVT